MELKLIAIVIATINPEAKADLDYYLTQMNARYVENNVKPLSKFSISEIIIGEEKPDLVVILEFPNKESFDNVFKSESYQELIPYRDNAFKKLELFITKN